MGEKSLGHTGKMPSFIAKADKLYSARSSSFFSRWMMRFSSREI